MINSEFEQVEGVTATPTLIPVNPHVEIQLDKTELQVDQVLVLDAQAVDIGLPYFTLIARDASASEGVPLGQVTYENEFSPDAMRVAGVELVSAVGGMYSAQFILRGLAPGAVDLWVTATGEIHYGYPGPATWGGGSSDPVTIQVVSD